MRRLNRLFEKKVDERQEMDLLRVEHICFWSMYWMLLASIIIQVFFVEEGGRFILGEWIVFMITSVLAVAGCIRKGVWSRQTKKIPGVKAYVRYSLIAMAAAGIPLGLLHSYRSGSGEMSIKITLISIAIYMIFMFVMTFLGFLLVGALARRREAKLTLQDAEEEDEED